MIIRINISDLRLEPVYPRLSLRLKKIIYFHVYIVPNNLSSK